MTDRPTYHAFTVRKYKKEDGSDSFWTKIGVVFAHKDGKGYDVCLIACRLTGGSAFASPRKSRRCRPALKA